MKISIVIPAYNESGNIIELIQRLINVCKNIMIDYEIILIIQGKDGTFELLQEFINKYSYNNIYIHYYPKPLGVGPAYKIGFNNIADDATHVLTMDADLNHQPEELPRFIKAMKKYDADIIIGSRYIPCGTIVNVHRWRYILSKTVNDLFIYIVGLRVRDKTNGYRLNKRKVVVNLRNKIKAKNFDFYIEYLILAQRKNFSIVEIPVSYIARKWGRSKMGLINTFFRYCVLIIRYLFNLVR